MRDTLNGVRATLTTLEPIDRLIGAGAISGAVGFAFLGLGWFVFAFPLLFLAAVFFALAFVHDRRSQ